MSSHHFVTEGQEPALIIGNGAECSFALLASLLEWCPYIVALDGAYNRLKKMGIKMDVVIGDFDSISIEEPDPDTEFIKIEDQNSTDLEKGIEYLLRKEKKEINAVWVTGNRLDHTLNNLSALAKYPQARLVFYDDYSKAFLLPEHFEKYYPKGEKLSLIPLGRVKEVSTQGLLYNLNAEFLDLKERTSSSNSSAANGKVRIDHRGGHLVMMESLDPKI